ncbi:MAG: hypothetical protein ACRDHZ_18185, partial [Ktedonobacteraceae bacterium]
GHKLALGHRICLACAHASASAVLSIKEHTNKMADVAWLPDGQHLALTGEDTFVHIWKTV